MHLAEGAELARDIDQVLLRLAEAQMAHMALHDALTGLPNRRLLVERITSALDRADRHGGEVAFCSAISTTSNGSTIPPDTPPGTRYSSRRPPGSVPCCARATRSPGSAAMSSS